MSKFLSRMQGLRWRSPAPSCSLHSSDRFVGRPHGMGQKPVVDNRGLITVAPDRMPRPGGCILDHRNLEALLDKLAQMRLDAHVRQHAAEDDPIDPALAQL